MLVLSRKPGEKIQIGAGIVLSVVAIEGKRVQLAVEAPRSVHIRRSELPEHSQVALVPEHVRS